MISRRFRFPFYCTDWTWEKRAAVHFRWVPDAVYLCTVEIEYYHLTHQY